MTGCSARDSVLDNAVRTPESFQGSSVTQSVHQGSRVSLCVYQVPYCVSSIQCHIVYNGSSVTLCTSDPLSGQSVYRGSRIRNHTDNGSMVR